MPIGLAKVTPTIVKRWRDALIGFLSAALLSTPILAPLLHLTPTAFAQWDAFAIVIVTYGAKFWGLPDDQGIDQLQSKIDQIKDKQNSANNTQGDH